MTLISALAILALGVDPTTALISSQIALSFGIPFAIVPLVWLTSRPELMGECCNRRRTTVFGAVVAISLIVLDVVPLPLSR